MAEGVCVVMSVVSTVGVWHSRTAGGRAFQWTLTHVLVYILRCGGIWIFPAHV